MNPWIEKSIMLANKPDYLDKLFSVYPTGLNEIRNIPNQIKNEIKQAYGERNKRNLIQSLLKLEKFPIDHPYVSSLRWHPFLLDINPKTIDRIGEILLSTDYETLLKLASTPISVSKQFGNSFRAWLHASFLTLPEAKFEKNGKPCFLQGDDDALREFAIRKFRIDPGKGLDFVLKIRDRYFLGEAKFLTNDGGTQNGQFRAALAIANINQQIVRGFAVLDGILWFPAKRVMHKEVTAFKGLAMSALLLNDFIKHNA